VCLQLLLFCRVGTVAIGKFESPQRLHVEGTMDIIQRDKFAWLWQNKYYTLIMYPFTLN
jgi:hypothetical protein